MTPKVAIIILNWNGAADTIECLESLKKIDYENYFIVLVDNHSEGNDIERITKDYGNLIEKVIVSEKNLGFSGGNNLGIQFALQNSADYVLLLNNDTTVEPNFLELLINVFEIDEQAGIVAPKINYYDQPEIIWSAGGIINKIRGSGVAFSDKLLFKTKTAKASSVDFVSGCCMLIKKEVIQEVGGFDENYFLYNEDTDICQKVLKYGYKIFVQPDSVILHKVKGATKKNISTVALYYETRNRLYFVKKNYGQFYFITGLYMGTTMLIKCLFWIITGKSKNVIAVLKSFKDFAIGKTGKIS